MVGSYLRLSISGQMMMVFRLAIALFGGWDGSSFGDKVTILALVPEDHSN